MALAGSGNFVAPAENQCPKFEIPREGGGLVRHRAGSHSLSPIQRGGGGRG